MDHSPIRQTFKFGKSISTAAKSSLNFIQLSSLVAKYCKMWNIYSCKVCKFCKTFVLRTEKRYHYVEMWQRFFPRNTKAHKIRMTLLYYMAETNDAR